MLTQSWQKALADTLSDPQELCRLLELDSIDQTSFLLKTFESFPFKIPRQALAMIEKGNPNDPILLQFMPQQAENLESPGYTYDPLEEAQASPIPGLLHKYQGRVLLVLTGACAVNCRYCFRRHFPYTEHQHGIANAQVLNYLEQDQSIEEVILSGGDPLAINDKALEKLLHSFETIGHIKRLRIHTRLPIFIPQRFNESLLNILQTSKLQTVIVFHINHPYEITPYFKEKTQLLKHYGITLLNQSVLLKGINDCANSLTDLSLSLFEHDILPYYLHLPDKVSGTAHFDVSIQQAQTLVKTITNRLPGYLVPKLVSEQPGEGAKSSISL